MTSVSANSERSKARNLVVLEFDGEGIERRPPSEEGLTAKVLRVSS
jgi:hypothetical protein